MYTQSIITCHIPGHRLCELRRQAKAFVQAGLQTSTQKTYSSGEKRFMAFCEQYSISPLPCSEETLVLFVTY